MDLEGKNLKPPSINLEVLGQFRPSAAGFCPEISPNQEKLEEGEARVGSVKRLAPRRVASRDWASLAETRAHLLKRLDPDGRQVGAGTLGRRRTSKRLTPGGWEAGDHGGFLT